MARVCLVTDIDRQGLGVLCDDCLHGNSDQTKEPCAKCVVTASRFEPAPAAPSADDDAIRLALAALHSVICEILALEHFAGAPRSRCDMLRDYNIRIMAELERRQKKE